MTNSELVAAKDILNQVRQRITETANGDLVFTFALRRYIYKYLSYDERGTPAERTKIKLAKIKEQREMCADPECPVPGRKISKSDEPELDRIDPVKGYTMENTVLLHHECHRRAQDRNGYC
jgi:hypothetical protein